MDPVKMASIVKQIDAIPQKLVPESSEIIELYNKTSNEIVVALLDKFIFFQHFEEQNIDKDILAHMFIILGKACGSSSVASVQSFIKNLNYHKRSILLRLQQYVVFLMATELKQLYIESLFFIPKFLKTYQEMMPSSSSEVLSIILPLLNLVCEKSLKSSQTQDEYSSIEKMLCEISKQNEFFLQHHDFSGGETTPETQKMHMLKPPNDFRSISIIPTSIDLKSQCTFLRPNIVKGPYENVEHYLDVQFRLLREDYIMPLRYGVAEYLNLKKNKESLKHCEYVKVYEDVQIQEEVIANGNLFHVLKFNHKRFLKVNWDNSKHLLTGSILCLSSDEFKTIYFASIKIRKPEELKKGLLTVELEQTTENDFTLLFSEKLVVLESSAYFESYKHNLMALVNLDSKIMPFKRYIIDVKKNVFNPIYLNEDTEYDMMPLFSSAVTGKILNEYMPVKVLDILSWPSEVDLSLDKSQLLAIQTAVTKEFAIIQGPPGTGKTFVGLKTVEVLLMNQIIWFDETKNNLPILIVCFTNHALDQFLEGILGFTDRIARIGGRSSNDEVLPYQLQTLRMKSRLRFSNSDLFHLKDQLLRLKKKIQKMLSQIENCNKYIIEEGLEKYMINNHLKTLREGLKKKSRNDFTLSDWLGISSVNFVSDVSKKYVDKRDKTENKISQLDVIEDEEKEFDDGDDQYVENERNIDYYEEYEYIKIDTHKFEQSETDLEQKVCDSVTYQMQQYIANCLNVVEIMPEEVALSVKNVWKLNAENRWKLYKLWLNKYIIDQHSNVTEMQKELRKVLQEIDIEKAKVDFDLLKRRSTAVVGMTTNGAAKFRHLVNLLNPAILVVEEAAHVLESHIVTSLAPNTCHLILIGDQQQLRPSTTMHILSAKYAMNISLFERMILNKIEYSKLSVQHRMRPEIASLIVPHIYPHLENHKSVTEFDNILGVKTNVFFISHNFHESYVNDSKTRSNMHEAEFLVQLCGYLILQGYEPSRITILTTYTGQLFILKDLARKSDKEGVQDVRITIVDNFQGEENDIILLSFVRSNDVEMIGFLRDPNRVCVALSRARKGFFCIGNFNLFAQKSSLWKNILETLVHNQQIGSSLSLICQNHPDTITKVETAKDFNKVPDGGCSRKCEVRRFCGHTCWFMCHPFDHEQIECKKPCLKVCERNHLCDKKCFEECFCIVLTERILAACNHTVQEICGKPENEILCKNPCDKQCIMGHKCDKKCFEKCYCTVQIEVTLTKCGHTVRKLCGKPEDEVKCQNPCNKKCLNDHSCPKQCYEKCYCKVLIDKTLTICGHKVTEECGKPETKIKCPVKCNRLLRCKHPCTQNCGERCTLKCLEPCLKSCPKGHPCLQKCYEHCKDCEIVVDKICPENHKYQVTCHKQWQSFCPTVVERTLKRCGHTAKMTCGRSEFTFRCMSECTKILKCTHKCKKKCSEICERVCFQPCIKSCTNGHNCPKLCHEPCGPCAVIVEKVLSKCGHTIKAQCSLPVDSIICSYKCEKKLSCGHYCMNKCGEPCTANCKHMEETKSLVCGHSVQVECYIFNCQVLLDKKFNDLLNKCKERCNDVLPCGHNCTGTCGGCYQRRLHVPCSAPCNRILICGHKCLSTCSYSCPPCKQPCANKCSHQICRRLCSEPCFKCIKPCEWACPHSKCSKPCYAICDRNPCNEPCPKLLPCNHPCTGFCGEPCPSFCQLCGSKSDSEFLGDFYLNARYVVLEDCSHIFEVLGLNQWMKVAEGESTKLLMKTCPLCEVVIRKNLRYNNIIKSTLLKIEKVKLTTKWNRARNEKIQSDLLAKSVSLTSSEFFPPRNDICRSLQLNFIRNIQELTNIENIISVANSFSEMKLPLDNEDYNNYHMQVQSLIAYFDFNSKWLTSFILKSFLKASEQQQIQLSYEVHRLKLIEKLFYALPNILDSHLNEFENCMQYILNYEPFSDKMLKSFVSAFDNFLSKLDDKAIFDGWPLTFPFLKAMNMSKGHWYHCLEGHIYCIIDYVGTIEKACYECQKKREIPDKSNKVKGIPNVQNSINLPELSLIPRRDKSSFNHFVKEIQGRTVTHKQNHDYNLTQTNHDSHPPTSKPYLKNAASNLGHGYAERNRYHNQVSQTNVGHVLPQKRAGRGRSQVSRSQDNRPQTNHDYPTTSYIKNSASNFDHRYAEHNSFKSSNVPQTNKRHVLPQNLAGRGRSQVFRSQGYRPFQASSRWNEKSQLYQTQQNDSECALAVPSNEEKDYHKSNARFSKRGKRNRYGHFKTKK